jgi:small subunit ribosomal protein S5
MTTETNTEKKTAAEEKKGKKPARAPRAAKKQDTTAPDVEERVVAVNRVAKVVKGGRRFSFSALVIVGDKKGKVGYGLGKAKEVPDAIRKASQEATRRMIQVPIESGTIPHEVLGEFDAGKILFKPASEGTGVKAAGACRSILELVGIKDVLTKSLRGSNPHNVVKATFEAFKQIRSVDSVAAARGVDAKSLRMSNK